MRRSRNYSPELENLEIQLLMEGISRHYGLDFNAYASAPMRRKVWETVRREKVQTISGLQEKLLHDYQSMERFLASLTSNGGSASASFFKKFRTEVAPMLRTYPSVRIWHTGCASISDIYALGILLVEEGLYERSLIYATDVNETNLHRVQDGVFSLSVADELEEQYTESGGRHTFNEYFARGRTNGIYDPALRKNMVFSQHSLATDGSFNEFNSILCRNILSAYNEPTRIRAHDVLYESLGLFGILALGPRESIHPSPRELCYTEIDPEHKLYRKIR